MIWIFFKNFVQNYLPVRANQITGGIGLRCDSYLNSSDSSLTGGLATGDLDNALHFDGQLSSDGCGNGLTDYTRLRTDR